MSPVRRFTAGFVAAAAFLLVPAVPAGAAAEARVVYYDTSAAEEFVSAVDDGATIWNRSVTSVRLEPVPAGQRADIRITADDGWPYAITESLGRGEINMGREAVVQGHFPTRIAAHEIGHILGLPDDRTGRCEDLMAGGSAPATCRNAVPNAQEAAKVQAAFETAEVSTRSFGPALVYRD
jgi:snapalysin